MEEGLEGGYNSIDALSKAAIFSRGTGLCTGRSPATTWRLARCHRPSFLHGPLRKAHRGACQAAAFRRNGRRGSRVSARAVREGELVPEAGNAAGPPWRRPLPVPRAGRGSRGPAFPPTHAGAAARPLSTGTAAAEERRKAGFGRRFCRVPRTWLAGWCPGGGGVGLRVARRSLEARPGGAGARGRRGPRGGERGGPQSEARRGKQRPRLSQPVSPRGARVSCAPDSPVWLSSYPNSDVSVAEGRLLKLSTSKVALTREIRAPAVSWSGQPCRYETISGP
ncbi:uncharacterized protein LOC129338476 [Eublepharis macularius]|uniref:Uncharacterized protein LOC129338476 n=1 Tax=Eublepharis macularius TaxID=481883 RepID=A0AA97JZV9_EUBMA|nr:uncharacterized protein LOC129338476 [Eublepharis macularius]